METKKLTRLMKPLHNFSLGGAIGASMVDPNGNDYDAINADRTERWAAADAAKQGIRSPNSGYQTNPDAFINTMTIGAPQSLMASFAHPSPSSLAAMGISQPGQTTWQQDSDARQGRITGYADKLKAMEANGRANSLMGSSATMNGVGIGRPDLGYPSPGFADGGKIDPDELMRQMSAKYGAPSAGPAQPATTPSGPITSAVSKGIQAAQQSAPQQLQQPQGIVGLIRNRGVQIDRAAGYANGGKPRGMVHEARGTLYDDAEAEGARIVGPGTATSDSIPAVIGGTGEPIRVANGERIISVAQDRFLERYVRTQGFESLDEFLQAGTGKPVGPTVRDGYRAAASGLDTNENYGNEGRVTRNDIMIPSTVGGAGARGQQLLKANTGADPDITIKGAVTSRLPGSNTNVTNWNSGTDVAARTIDQRIAQQEGTGTMSVRQGDGSFRNTVIDQPQYTAADGSTTSDWSKTAQYAQGQRDAQNQRNQLANMQRMRAETDAYDPNITDPNVRTSARAHLAEMDAVAGKQGEAQNRLIDGQNKLLEGQIKREQLAESATQRAAREKLSAAYDTGHKGMIRMARRQAEAAGIKLATDDAPTLQHVETDAGIMAFDPRSGTMTPVAGPGGEPVKGGKPLTEFQGKSTGFGMRAAISSKIIDEVGKNGEVQPSLLKRAAEAVPLVGESLGTMANHFQTPEQQQVEQAHRDFINAVLRQESGAAIGASEFDNARKQYFPQPGDSKEVIAQKKANRELAIKGFQISAGPGGKNIGGSLVQQAPQFSQVLSEAQAAIAAGASRDAVIKRLKEHGVTDLGGL